MKPAQFSACLRPSIFRYIGLLQSRWAFCASLCFAILQGCGGSSDPAPRQSSTTDQPSLESAMDIKLKTLLTSEGRDYAELMLPDDSDLSAIPFFPQNAPNSAQIELGRQLFHDPVFGIDAGDESRKASYSCASCHHVQAGFKSGVAQGIGDGGIGFGLLGEGRLADQDVLKKLANDSTLATTFGPDVQDIASPTILNSAYQEVMLWNGQFGNAQTGALINAAIDAERLQTEGTPKIHNGRQFPGLETQALAGMGVHRLRVDKAELLALPAYRELFMDAYPQRYRNETDLLEADAEALLDSAAFAIANFERTVLANQAPFQRWLRGDLEAMTEEEKRGANLFFGEAQCAACHQGPALSSKLGAPEEDIFFAIGFDDLQTDNVFVIGEIKDATKLGRGGFTGEDKDNYRFKIPSLYNLKDSAFLGHGASFSSVEAVIRYKNKAEPQQADATVNLDARFVPLGLSDAQVRDLTAFVEDALYDADLARYVPDSVISGLCFPVNDEAARLELGCD